MNVLYFTCKCGLISNQMVHLNNDYQASYTELKKRPWAVYVQNEILLCPRCERKMNWFNLVQHNSRISLASGWIGDLN